MGQFYQWNRLAIKFSLEPKIALQISWRTESESGYVWAWKFLNPERKICGFKKYPDTSERGLKVPSHCHLDKVWERHSCDNGKEICQKVRCMFRFFFLFINQTCCMFSLFLRYLKRMRNRTDFRAKHENSILQLFSFRVKVGKPMSNLFISIRAIVDYPKRKVLEDGVTTMPLDI